MADQAHANTVSLYGNQCCILWCHFRTIHKFKATEANGLLGIAKQILEPDECLLWKNISGILRTAVTYKVSGTQAQLSLRSVSSYSIIRQTQ